MRKTAFILLLLFTTPVIKGQEVWFFSEGTDLTYYDQGLVDVANLGSSLFEHTYPPGLPQYNDKVPCSANAFKGSSSLKFNYTSSSSGNWKTSIFRAGWTSADISGMDSLSFYVLSSESVPASALPLIGLKAMNTSGSAEVSSVLYPLADYNSSVPAGIWTRITFPLAIIKNDPANSQLSFSDAKAVIFSQSETNGVSRTLYIDEITLFRHLDVIPGVVNLSATGYDSHVEVSWTLPMNNLLYRIYASYDGGNSYGIRGETTDSIFLDFVPAEGRNSSVNYIVKTVFTNRESGAVTAGATTVDYTDDQLLDMTERYAFRYFWEGAHRQTGMALERTDGDDNTVASGATGMGLMAMIAACERGYKPRDEVKDRILLILSFLETCDRHHGAWSHWYFADTKHTKPFSTYDNGGDLVETSYVAQALIALKNYFSDDDPKSIVIRNTSDALWRAIEWDWYRQGGQNVLYWHWSPDYGFAMNMKVGGWCESMLTYIMAASSPTHTIPAIVYSQGWALNGAIVNERTYYGYKISLSPNYGGPLFWIHYSHLGINPHGLKDKYADYWQEYVNTASIHHAYAVENPFSWKNYGDRCWGLTASDDPDGYRAHQPMTVDNGTISPTAALASMPYVPEEAMKALRYFYRERGAQLFGKYGPYDAFNDYRNWVKKAYIGIDQGPIAIMIENYRSGLLWNKVMKDTDVQAGLTKLGFQFISSVADITYPVDEILVYPNPSTGIASINLTGFDNIVLMIVFDISGNIIEGREIRDSSSPLTLDLSSYRNGLYLIRFTSHDKAGVARLLIRK